MTLAAAALGLLSLGGAAAETPLESPEKPERQCFWARQINGFAAENDRIVNVRVGVRQVYQFEMFGPCHDVDWAHRIAVVSRGGSRICDGLDAEIIAPTTLGPRRCPVRNVRKLSDAEVAALKGRGRP